jgi:hypothetical protein
MRRTCKYEHGAASATEVLGLTIRETGTSCSLLPAWEQSAGDWWEQGDTPEKLIPLCLSSACLLVFHRLLALDLVTCSPFFSHNGYSFFLSLLLATLLAHQDSLRCDIRPTTHLQAQRRDIDPTHSRADTTRALGSCTCTGATLWTCKEIMRLRHFALLAGVCSAVFGIASLWYAVHAASLRLRVLNRSNSSLHPTLEKESLGQLAFVRIFVSEP